CLLTHFRSAGTAREGLRSGDRESRTCTAGTSIGERAQDHLAQIPGELVRRALPASAGLVSLGHEERLPDARSGALNARAQEVPRTTIRTSIQASPSNCFTDILVNRF